jgi:hypothetical protein
MFKPEQSNKLDLKLPKEALGIVMVVILMHAAFLYAILHFGSVKQSPMHPTLVGAKGEVSKTF